MTLLLIIICTSLGFSAAFPVLYRSSKHTGHAERYGVSILPTYFPSKLTTMFTMENDTTSFDGSSYKITCASCHDSSAVLEESVVEQEANSWRQNVLPVTGLFKLDSSQLKTTIETKYLNTVAMSAINSSELPGFQKHRYIQKAPVSTKESSMITAQLYSTTYSTNKQQKVNLDIYSTTQDSLSPYTGSSAIGYSSTREHQTLEDETTAVQLENPTKIDQTTEHQYSSVPSMNYEHSMDMENITSEYIPKHTYSKDTGLPKDEEILHEIVQQLNQQSPTINYNTGSTEGGIERKIDGMTTSNQGITVMKHKPSSTPGLIHESIQSNTLESFTLKNARNEICDKNLKTMEHEERNSLVPHENNIGTIHSNKSENRIETTQHVETDGPAMLATIITTKAQQNSNLVTVNTEKYITTYSNGIQFSTTVAKKEQTYNPSSVQNHAKESYSRFLDNNFQISTVHTTEGHSTEYNEPNTSEKTVQAVGQKTRYEHYREMENISLRYFTSVDTDQLKDVEHLETTEFENELDIETLEINSSKNNNSEERVEAVKAKNEVITQKSQGPRIIGEQSNSVTKLSCEGNNRTGVNPQQRFTSIFRPKQNDKDIEMQEKGKKPDHSREYYHDEEKESVATELLPTAPVVHSTVKQHSALQIMNQRDREELLPRRIQYYTLAPNAREEDIDNFETIEGEEELELAVTTFSPISSELNSGERKGKIGNAVVAHRRLESMRVAPNRYDERDRNENGDRQNNFTVELRKKQKPHKHFETEELEERSKLRNLNSKLWSKDDGRKNRGEKVTKASKSEEVTISTFAKIMKIKKEKSTVGSEEREEINKTSIMKNFKLHRKITQINGTDLFSNFTKIMKEKKRKYTVITEEQRKIYQNKDVKKSELHRTTSDFTKRMKVRILKDNSRDETAMNGTTGSRKPDRKRIQEQKAVTIFIKTRKVRNQKHTLSIEERDNADKTDFTSKHKLSRKLQDQRRQHSRLSAATVSNFPKMLRGKKQKHSLKYLGREEARRGGGPENLEHGKKKSSSRWQFFRKISGKDLKFKDIVLPEHELSISQPNKKKAGRPNKENGNDVKGNGHTRNFQFGKKNRNIIAKKEDASSNEKAEEDIHKVALILRPNQQKGRKKDKNVDSKKQSEKISPYLTKMKKQKRRTMILFGTSPMSTTAGTFFLSKFFRVEKQGKLTTLAVTKPIHPFFARRKQQIPRKEHLMRTTLLRIPTSAFYHRNLLTIAKKNKFPRFAAEILNTTLFVKRKKLAKIWPQKRTTLFIATTVPYQERFFKMPVQSKSISVAVPKAKGFPNKQYWDRKKEPSEKTMNLPLPTVAFHQSGFQDKQQRKTLSRYPLKLPVTTLFTISKAREYFTPVADTYPSKYRKRLKEVKHTKFAVTKPMSMWFTIWKGHNLGVEQSEETTGLVYPITIAYGNKLLTLPKRTEFTRHVPTMPLSLMFTKRKKQKLKPISSRNTTTSFIPTTIYRPNNLDRFPDGNKSLETFMKSHIMRMFTKLEERIFKDLPAKTVAPFIPTRRSYLSKFHEMSTQNKSFKPPLVLPNVTLFTKRYGQNRANEMTTQITELFPPVTHAYQRKQHVTQPKRKLAIDDITMHVNKSLETFMKSHIMRMFTKVEEQIFKDLPAKTVAPFIPTRRSYLSKFHEMSTQNKSFKPPLVLPNVTLFTKQYGQDRANEMTTQIRELFPPVTHAYQRKQHVTQPKRKLAIDDITMPVFSFLTKWKEKKLRRKRPLTTSTPAIGSHKTTFRKTRKQDRRTKFPATKANWMFQQSSQKVLKCPIPHSEPPTTEESTTGTWDTEESDEPLMSLTVETGLWTNTSSMPISSTIEKTLTSEMSTSEMSTSEMSTSEMSTSETQDSGRPSESTCAETSYEDQDLTCAASWSSPIQITASISDSSTGDIIYDESSSSVSTSGTSHTTEWITLDSVPSDSEPSLSTSTPSAIVSYSEPPTTEESTTDTWNTEESDEPLMSLTAETGLWTNPSSMPISSTVEKTHISSMNSTMSHSSVPSTEYSSYLVGEASTLTTGKSQTLQESTIVNEGMSSDRSSSTSRNTDNEFSVSNVPPLTIEPSTLETSDSQTSQESTTLNQDFHTDWSSITALDTDTEFSISNLPQLTSEPSTLASSDSPLTQESTILNVDYHTDWSSTTASDTELSISNVPQFTSEPSTLETSDSEITQESNIVSEDYEDYEDYHTASDIDTELLVSNQSQFTSEPITLAASDSEITQEPTTLNQGSHNDWSTTAASDIDTELSVSNVPPFTIEPIAVETSDSQITKESTILNQDFPTDWSSTTAFDIDTELSIANVPPITSEPSTLATKDSQLTQESSVVNQDLLTDWSSSTVSGTDTEFSVSNVPQFTNEPSKLPNSDSQITQESTILNEDFHTDRSSTTARNIVTESSISNVPQFTSEPVYPRADDFVFSSSTNMSPISDSLLSNGISVSSSTSSLSTLLTPEISSYPYWKYPTSGNRDLHNHHAVRSTTSTHYTNVGLSNLNLSHDFSKFTNGRTTDLNLLPSSDMNGVLDSLPSAEMSHSSPTSSLTTPLIRNKTSSTLHDEGNVHISPADRSSTTAHYISTEVASADVQQSIRESSHAGTNDILASSIGTSSISNSLPLAGESISSSKSPLSTPVSHKITHDVNSESRDGLQQGSYSVWSIITAPYSGTKSSTSQVTHSVGDNVAGNSAVWSPGLIPWTAGTRSSLPTAAPERTKQRTCRRLMNASPGDSYHCAFPTPPLTLRRTLRRRLRSTTPSHS